MRLDRLDLVAYGPFTNVSIDFDRAVGLHVVDAIVGGIAGVEIGENEVSYGGFPAKGSGKVVRERRPGSIEERLREEIRALDIDWEEEREKKPARKRKAAGQGPGGSTKA